MGGAPTSEIDTGRVTRVEVNDETGRPFARGPDPEIESFVQVQLQDEGRTLKVLVNPQFSETGRE